jgi:hypothetical protein
MGALSSCCVWWGVDGGRGGGVEGERRVRG